MPSLKLLHVSWSRHVSSRSDLLRINFHPICSQLTCHLPPKRPQNPIPWQTNLPYAPTTTSHSALLGTQGPGLAQGDTASTLLVASICPLFYN